MGLFQVVFVKDSDVGGRVTNVRSSCVKTGLKGYHGNKVFFGYFCREECRFEMLTT